MTERGATSIVARPDWRTRLPFFYGWVVAIAAFVSMGLSCTPWYTFSVFYVSLLGEFGWSRGPTALAFSIFVVMHGVGSIAAGALSDRLGPQKVIAGGAVLEMVSLLACSRIGELWQLYLFYGVLGGLGMAVAGWIPCVAIINRWFSARLGAAIGIGSAGAALSILVMAPVTQLLILAVGWRTAYQVLAAAILLGVAPIALLVMGARPEELGLQRDGKPAPQGPAAPPPRRVRVVDAEWTARTWTVAAAARTRRFWAICAMAVLTTLATQTVFVHQVAFLVDGGYDTLLAASIVGLIGFVSIGGKIGWGWVSDRVGREVTWTMGLCAMAVGIALLIATRLATFPLAMYLFAVAFALGYAASAPLVPVMTADIFAGRRFATIYGVVMFANGLGAAAGAWFAGYIFDLTGDYLPAFGFAVAASLLGIVAAWIAAPRQIRAVPGRR